jgi:hypothetical protein
MTFYPTEFVGKILAPGGSGDLPVVWGLIFRDAPPNTP